MSISNLLEKIKGFQEEQWHNILVTLIIIIVAFSSFALGRFSAREGSVAEVLYPEEVVRRAENSLNESPKVVASSRGTKYYYPWCSGVENLTEANKIEFKSAQEAERVGYTLATNCDGLN